MGGLPSSIPQQGQPDQHHATDRERHVGYLDDLSDCGRLARERPAGCRHPRDRRPPKQPAILRPSNAAAAAAPRVGRGTPLHRARLFGLPDKLFDALDETALQPTQIKSFIETLLSCDTLPEPELDVSKFVHAVAHAQKGLPLVFDPISQKMKPWIDLRKLEWAMNRKCGKGACAIM